MTFNSLEFILIFLPLCYAGFLLVHRGLGWPGVYRYLLISSLMFYACFNLALVGVLIASITFNYFVSTTMHGSKNDRVARGLLIFAIMANLSALGYLKYVNFFIEITNSVSGANYAQIDLIVPVGVSFFTFTQIGYLIEASAARVNRVGFVRYALFTSFFPCVTAGPLLLQREMFEQMSGRVDPAFTPTRVAIGLTMFGIGLAKKVLIADSIAPYSDLVFNGVASGRLVEPAEAWIGALCYTFQLYFDFSGYSDMAIGIAFLFGFRLPLNFNSPFKATSISDFWNRWHMTMTRFFTTFLFTHLSMRNARKAAQKRYGRRMKWFMSGAVPIFFTFVVAGVWHGAGWTFVVYGLVHGTALAVNHAWREWQMPVLPSQVGWLLTMTVVVIALVVFRASDLGTAGGILSSMLGLADLQLGDQMGSDWVVVDRVPAILAISACGFIVLAMPNSQEILRSEWMSSDKVPENIARSESRIHWAPTAAWAVTIAILIVAAATSLNDSSGFLYYDY